VEACLCLRQALNVWRLDGLAAGSGPFLFKSELNEGHKGEGGRNNQRNTATRGLRNQFGRYVPESELSAMAARHSRVQSSNTARVRKCRPQAS
jgi:hypothetical protein